jgi:hypothetical protein
MAVNGTAMEKLKSKPSVYNKKYNWTVKAMHIIERVLGTECF